MKHRGLRKARNSVFLARSQKEKLLEKLGELEVAPPTREDNAHMRSGGRGALKAKDSFRMNAQRLKRESRPTQKTSDADRTVEWGTAIDPKSGRR